MPKPRFDAINERFRKEAVAIKDAFASHLGAAPRFMFRAHDFETVDEFRLRRAGAEAGRWRGPTSHRARRRRRSSTSTDLADVPDAPQLDSVTRLVSGLGAEVIDERRRR